MAKKSLKRILLCLTIGTVLICSWPGSVVAGDGRVEALEARITELESLVQQLLSNQAGSEEKPDARAEELEASGSEQAIVPVGLDEEPVSIVQETDKHSYQFGGFIKADFMYSDFGGGSLASGSSGRDFYSSKKVPVGAEGETYLDFSAKESRLNFKTSHMLDDGALLGGFLEIDFQLSAYGNERVSNSYNPRLRHAFLSYDKWLFGQTWTTLFNVSALPENLDFIGPAESTIFGRQVMIRYTDGPWQIAIENPETTITPYGGGSQIVADDNQVPDAVLRYTLAHGWGSLTVAGIMRQMAYQDDVSGIDDKTTAYGISLSGKIHLGEGDDLRWMASVGEGLGRYIGLNTSDGAVLDADGNLHAIGVFGVFASYRHFWNDQWRSNLTLGYLSVDNDVALSGQEVTRDASSVHLNLIYNPMPRLDFGIEFLYADRELESGDDGDLKRIQFSAKYAY